MTTIDFDTALPEPRRLEMSHIPLLDSMDWIAVMNIFTAEETQ